MTEETILYPCIPYLGHIDGTGPVTPETVIRIEGAVLEATSRFNINFQCGPVPRNNIALQIYAQLCDGMICLNSLRYGIWDEEEWISIIPIKMEEVFEIIVQFQFDHYKIIINNQAFEFPQRISYNEIGYLCINGDVSIIKISYKSITDAAIKSTPSGMKNSSFSTNSQSPCFEETLNDQSTDLPANTNIETNSNCAPASWFCKRLFCRLCTTLIVMIIVSTIVVILTGNSRRTHTITVPTLELPPGFHKLE